VRGALDLMEEEEEIGWNDATHMRDEGMDLWMERC